MKRNTGRYYNTMREAETISAIDAINAKAREARLLCNDIIRQTSLQPYYGKRGGAAMYAPEDGSAEQQRRINTALRHLQHATRTLYHIAVAGGTAEAVAKEIRRGDCVKMTTQIYDAK